MILNIATLTFLLFTTCVIQIVGIYFQAKLNKSFKGTKYWVLGNILNAIGVFLFFIRPFLSNKFISIILPSLVIVLGQIVIYIGIALFINRNVKIKSVIFMLLVLSIGLFHFTYINNDINIRAIISSIAMAVNSFLISFELLKNKNTSIKYSANFLASILILYGIFYIIRSINFIFNNMSNIFEPSLMQISVFVISICVNYIFSFALIIMVNQRFRGEEIEAKKKLELIFQISPEAIDISRLKDGLIIEANDRFLSMTGFTREELVGNTTINLGLWNNLLERKKFLEGLIRNEVCENYEMELKKKDGTTFIGLTSARIIEFNGEKYSLNLIKDITVRKTIENIIKKNEEKFKAIANYTANLEMWIGTSGELLWINPAVKKFTDYSPEEYIAMPDFLKTLIFVEDLPKVREIYYLALNNEDESGEDIEFRCVKRDYSVFWLSINWNKVYDDSENFLGIRVSGRDITKFKHANDQINILSQAMEQSAVSIVMTDLNGNIEYINNKFTEITGYTKEEVIGKNPRILKADYDSRKDYINLWNNVLNGIEWQGQFKNKKKNGEYYWESANISPIFNSEGKIEKILAVKEDITESKRLENELKLQARTDELTEISNRRFFVEAVEHELIRTKGYSQEYAFLMLDIDHFKKINDNFGHAIGDMAIKKAAEVFKKTVREEDIIGRIGGEEFGILLVETDFQSAVKTAEKIRKNVESIELFDYKGNRIKLTISIGITKYTNERSSLHELMVAADKALYKAKNEGRNRVVKWE
ncbi:PAS domain S-box protein [Clostridium sp. C2-6-12]|uniref:PAS domain S-box protein n=1 Tax=Clostridium sp. C2-6-12 TaxID=2698832 RepID=UPI00136A68E5|nr:PAS domain S-box protein [Clostridium sp. C2-6-12]